MPKNRVCHFKRHLYKTAYSIASGKYTVFAATKEKAKKKKATPKVVNKSKKGFGKPSLEESQDSGQPKDYGDDESILFALDFIGRYCVSTQMAIPVITTQLP